MAPSHPHRLSRRRFVHTGSAAIASLGLGLARAADPKKIPIGLQLYSVRNECQKDLAAVIQAVGKMGYKGVEFAGYYGRDAKTLRKLLDDNGLVCCGTHTPYESDPLTPIPEPPLGLRPGQGRQKQFPSNQTPSLRSRNRPLASALAKGAKSNFLAIRPPHSDPGTAPWPPPWPRAPKAIS